MHKRYGFTFIEVMIALAIIAMMMAPLWVLQGTIITSIAAARDRLAWLWFSTQTLYQARRNQKPGDTQFSFKNQLQFPVSSAVYELKPVAKNSSLAGQHRLFGEKISIQAGKTKQSPLISFLYKPESAQ